MDGIHGNAEDDCDDDNDMGRRSPFLWPAYTLDIQLQSETIMNRFCIPIAVLAYYEIIATSFSPLICKICSATYRSTADIQWITGHLEKKLVNRKLC